MKKRPEKKLALGKIKIASLSKQNQQMVKAGMPPPPPTPNCHTTAVHTNVVRCMVYTACDCVPIIKGR